MLTLVHLLLLGQMIHLTASSTSSSKEHHHRRHAPKNTPHIRHKTSKIRTRNVIPFVQSQFSYQGLPVLPNNHQLAYTTNYLDKPGAQVYFIQPGERMDSAAYNTIGKEFMWTNEDQLERGVLNNVGDDVPRSYLEGTREQRKLPMDEDLIAGPNEDLKIDPKISHPLPYCQGRLPKSDYNLLNNIITKMTPEAQNTLIEVLVKNLEDKTKGSSAKQSTVYSKPPLQLLMKQNPAQDKSALPSLLLPTQEEKQINVNGTGPLVQPFSLTMDKSKIQSLYNILNEGKIKSLGRSNATISVNRNSDAINQMLADEQAKASECIKCLDESTSTLSPRPSPTRNNNTRASQPHVRYCQAHKPRGMDLDSRVVNLTQIFNVHPRLLVVNSNIPSGGRMAGSKRSSKSPSVKTKNKSCGKTVEPVYYVDADNFPQNAETNLEEWMMTP